MTPEMDDRSGVGAPAPVYVQPLPLDSERTTCPNGRERLRQLACDPPPILGSGEMIKRAPRPDNGFLIIRNDVVRDKRISYRARGLLAAMLSYPDSWEFDRDWLAAQSDGEGVTAVRTALTELEKAGYLRRRRIQLAAGRFGWEHIVYDVPQDVSAGRTTGQESTDGKPADGNPPSYEVPRQRTDEEDVQVKDCPDSGRFAPSVGGDKFDELLINSTYDDLRELDTQDRSGDDEQGFEDWRTADRELFRRLVGKHIATHGAVWKIKDKKPDEYPITFSADVWYNAFRLKRNGKTKAMKWPGKFFENLENANARSGVADWLIDQGLEAV